MVKTVHRARKTKEEVNEHGLTALQEQFCHAYLIRFSVPHAEKLLSLKPKEGNKWMTMLKVRERINKIRVDTGKAFDVTRERVLQELMNVIYGSLKNLQGDDIVEWPDEDIAAVAGVEYDIFGGVSNVKRYDKLKAIEILNKMLGYNMPELTKNLNMNSEPISKEDVIAIAKQLRDAV